MRRAEHVTALRARCNQYLAWLVKTRGATSRHSGILTVYGYTTAAMHQLNTPHTHVLREPGAKDAIRLSTCGLDLHATSSKDDGFVEHAGISVHSNFVTKTGRS